MKDLNFLSIKEASRLLRKREIKSIELVQACINQIQDFDHETNAFITLCEEQAKETAKLVDEKIEKKTILSHLEGIPVGLKDIYDTANVLTTCHSKLFKNRVPLEDCTAWRRLANAGAILLGKQAHMNLHQVALLLICLGRQLVILGTQSIYRPAPLAVQVPLLRLAWLSWPQDLTQVVLFVVPLG